MVELVNDGRLGRVELSCLLSYGLGRIRFDGHTQELFVNSSWPPRAWFVFPALRAGTELLIPSPTSRTVRSGLAGYCMYGHESLGCC